MAPQETSAADGQLGGRAATIRATDMHRVTVPHDAMIHTLVQSSLCAHYNERAPHPPTRTRSGRNSATAGGSSPPPEHYHTCGELELRCIRLGLFAA